MGAADPSSDAPERAPESEGFDPTTFAEQLFFVTAHIESVFPDRVTTATGFVYRIPISETRHVQLLISNRHVLSGANKVTVRMPQAGESGRPNLGKATQVTMEVAEGEDPILCHPDPRVDVAALPIQPLVDAMVRMSAPPYFKAVSPDLMPSVEELKGLDAIEQLMFAGYPAGIFDRTSYTPVVRQGVAASPLQFDYNGLPAFLVDGSVFPGSSGSPVFLTPTAFSVARTGGVRLGGRKPFLLGILAQFHAVKVGGVVTELPGAFAAVFDQPLNLGIVFKSRVIDEIADLALAKHGYTRFVQLPAAGPQAA